MALCVFVALGLWQVQRLHWKHALIAQVDARIHAAPVAVPPDAALAGEGAKTMAYLRVRAAGRYEGRASALVRAATGLGTGYWAMTPLRTAGDRLVWINRGFVPAGTPLAAVVASTPAGAVTVTGLLRADEPGGSLLQANRPADDRWYARDLSALAASRRIGSVAPAFIDAQVEISASPVPSGLQPVPGLTQVHFPDNHLMYALTWFALAGLSAFGVVVIWRKGRWTR